MRLTVNGVAHDVADVGIGEVVDGIGVHPYGWANPPDSRAAALYHVWESERRQRVEERRRSKLEEAARAHGVTLSSEAFQAVVADDVRLNTQGLEFWLDHRSGRR